MREEHYLLYYLTNYHGKLGWWYQAGPSSYDSFHHNNLLPSINLLILGPSTRSSYQKLQSDLYCDRKILILNHPIWRAHTVIINLLTWCPGGQT